MLSSVHFMWEYLLHDPHFNPVFFIGCEHFEQRFVAALGVWNAILLSQNKSSVVDFLGGIAYIAICLLCVYTVYMYL